MGSIDCPICLQALSLSAHIGVCAPCGHPFHPDCFKTWQARCVAERGFAKCPSCNARVDSFASNVFLGTKVADVCCSDSDDDSSLGSCVSDDNEDERSSTPRSDAASEAGTDRQAKDDAADIGERSSDVICIDVDDDDSDNAAGTSTLSSHDANERAARFQVHRDKDRIERSQKRKSRDFALADDLACDYEKLRCKAKKYKRRARMLGARAKERSDHHMRLVSRQMEMETKEKELQEECDRLKSRVHDHDRELEALELDVARARREAASLEKLLCSSRQDVAHLRRENAAVERNMAKVVERYRKELDEARTQGMTEVQELLDERPKLVEEIRKLKMQLYGRKFSTHEKTQLQRSTNAAKFAKEVRNFVDQQEEEDRRLARRMREEERKKVVSKMPAKLSAHAARISRAAKKVAARQKSADNALGRASVSSASSRVTKSRGSHHLSASGIASEEENSSQGLSRKRPRHPQEDSIDSDDEPVGQSREEVLALPVQISSSSARSRSLNGSRNQSVQSTNSSRRSEQSAARSGLALISDASAFSSLTSSRVKPSVFPKSAASTRTAGSVSRRAGSADIRSLFR